MECPECGQRMEEGQIGCDGNIISWTKRTLSLKGDTLARGMAPHLKGQRCTACRLVLLRY